MGGSGISATTMDAPLSTLRSGDFAVNSHKKGEPAVSTACGNLPAGEAKSPQTPSAYSVHMTNYMFSPNILEIKAGQKPQLMLTSDRGRHTFTVRSLGVEVVVATGMTRTIELEVPANASGTIPFICRFHSGYGRGMVGELKIIPNSPSEKDSEDDSGDDY